MVQKKVVHIVIKGCCMHYRYNRCLWNAYKKVFTDKPDIVILYYSGLLLVCTMVFWWILCESLSDRWVGKDTKQLEIIKGRTLNCLPSLSNFLFILAFLINATIVQPLLLSIYALVECILFPHLAGISLQQGFMLP